MASCASLLGQMPITFQYFYDEIGQLSRVVDSTGIVIEYVYDPVGNMLEIKRSTLSSPGALTIFGFTPQQGPPLTTVIVQGQGFSPTPAANTVRFGSSVATVLSASTNSLVVSVPLGAATGPVSVIVGTNTTASQGSFTVVAAPVIATINRRVALANSTLPNLQVSGLNLTGASFSFLPGLSPEAVTLHSVVVNPAGTTATLNLTLNANATAAGTIAIVASSALGSSSPFPTSANSFMVVSSADESIDSDGDTLNDLQEAFFGSDRLSADTDGDGFSDAAEIAAGSDPVNPACTPMNCRVGGEAVSRLVSVLNTTALPTAPREADSITFSILNTDAPTTSFREADSITFSLLNGANLSSIRSEADNIHFSVCNGTASPACASALSSSRALSTLAEPRDSDGDGVPDNVEIEIGTSAFNVDTDVDGYPDGLELALGSDPLDSRSMPDLQQPAEAISPSLGVQNIAIFTGELGPEPNPSKE
jgi:YD repeat-containing protein